MTFVNWATFLGLPANTPDAGERWGTVAKFDGEPYWLEEAETRSKVLRALARQLDSASFTQCIIDRSRIRGLGAPDPSHPAYHASFSLWRKMTPDEIERLRRSETFEACVQISANAYLYDERLL